jgi:hypothetical protein
MLAVAHESSFVRRMLSEASQSVCKSNEQGARNTKRYATDFKPLTATVETSAAMATKLRQCMMNIDEWPSHEWGEWAPERADRLAFTYNFAKSIRTMISRTMSCDAENQAAGVFTEDFRAHVRASQVRRTVRFCGAVTPLLP